MIIINAIHINFYKTLPVMSIILPTNLNGVHAASRVLKKKQGSFAILKMYQLVS
jgi:hypothetical protein